MLVCPTCGKIRDVMYQLSDSDDDEFRCRFCANKSMVSSGGSNLIIAKYEKDGLKEIQKRIDHIPDNDDIDSDD